MKGRGDRPTCVGEGVREEISLILQNRVKDPGLGGITVTDVTMTVDLKIARVHYSVLGGDEERIEALDAISPLFRWKERFLTACHENPEGDAIGSELALALALRKIGKTATVLNSDPVPGNLVFLPAADTVVFEADGSSHEVAVVVGCGSLTRTGRVQAEVRKGPIRGGIHPPSP